MRFDEATKTFEISVRELADDAGFRRIGPSGDAWGRFGIGTELHARVLQARRQHNPNYQAEIHLQVKFPVAGWNVVVTGRLDGCVESDGAWLIEEFKTSAFSFDSGRLPVAVERHRRQLLFYCHLWAELGHSLVRGRLVYVDFATGDEHAIDLPYYAAEQRNELCARLEGFIADWAEREAVRQRKAELALRLPFPHSSQRLGQVKLSDAVRTAVHQKENLLAEAATGSGKTAAALHPALAEGLASGRQVLFLTAKTLQQIMAVKVLRAMNVEGGFRTLQMRAKEKMCANGQVICHEDFCPFAKGYPTKMERSGILDRLIKSQTHHDPDEVFAEAKREEVCPFEVQLELAARADAIVADYNYVFEPGTALKHLEDLSGAILLVDEAHNLPDRARQIFSPEICEKDLRAAAEYVACVGTAETETRSRRGSSRGRRFASQAQFAFGSETANHAGPFHQLKGALDVGGALLNQCAGKLPKATSISTLEPPVDGLRKLWNQWQPAFFEYLLWKTEQKVAQPDDAIVEVHFVLQRLLSMLQFYRPGFSCVVERRPDGVRLALICLDSALPLEPVFRLASASVLLSATLSPMETMRRSLGLEANRTSELSLPPPFPPENRKILILPQVRTTFAERAASFPRIGKLISDMADAVPGNVLVLFPSYEFLTKTAEHLAPIGSRLLTQRPNIAEAERKKILRALSEAPKNGVVLLAVMGGMYAEGVDYPGELLRAVLVVSPGLPQVTFERELLRRYYDEKEEAGFEYAYLQPGMTRVIQAAGRLIRTETDRGVIVLICQRFLQEPYSSRLPQHWYGESPAELVCSNPAGEIRRFFSAVS